MTGAGDIRVALKVDIDTHAGLARGVPAIAAVFAARGHYASPATFVAGFGPAMAACAGLALLGAAAGLVIPGRRQVPVSTVPVQHRAPKIEIRR